jgi:hypothetical protein
MLENRGLPIFFIFLNSPICVAKTLAESSRQNTFCPMAELCETISERETELPKLTTSPL